jgi:hypothetical protein
VDGCVRVAGLAAFAKPEVNNSGLSGV